MEPEEKQKIFVTERVNPLAGLAASLVVNGIKQYTINKINDKPLLREM